MFLADVRLGDVNEHIENHYVGLNKCSEQRGDEVEPPVHGSTGPGY
jgi:hypothetical protein